MISAVGKTEYQSTIHKQIIGAIILGKNMLTWSLTLGDRGLTVLCGLHWLHWLI